LSLSIIEDRHSLIFSLEMGDVICGQSLFPGGVKPLTEDCQRALQLIPSGRLTFGGGNPPTWSIESQAQRRKFLPAAFFYKTCTIRVHGLDSPPLPRSLESIARTMYYHVWPAAREAVERVLQQCIRTGGVGGMVTQTLTFDGHGPYCLQVRMHHPVLPMGPYLYTP